MEAILKRGLPIGAALIGIAGLTLSARADLVIRASDGATTVELARVTNGTGSASVLALNLFGGYTVALSAVSKPFDYSPGEASFQNETLQVTRTGGSGKTLTITMTDTGFKYPIPAGGPLSVTSSVSGNGINFQTGDKVTFQSFMDVHNAEFGKTQTTGLQGPFQGNGSANTTIGSTVNGSFTWNPLTNPAYSITSEFTLTLAAGAIAMLSGNTTLTPGHLMATPEPATAVMVAAGIPLIALGAWLRRRKKPQVGSAAD